MKYWKVFGAAIVTAILIVVYAVKSHRNDSQGEYAIYNHDWSSTQNDFFTYHDALRGRLDGRDIDFLVRPCDEAFRSLKLPAIPDRCLVAGESIRLTFGRSNGFVAVDWIRNYSSTQSSAFLIRGGEQPEKLIVGDPPK
jgi:hypothetical protein